MTQDADHRISSGKSMSFKGGVVYDTVPKEIAEALIERKVAVLAPADEKTETKDTTNGKR